MKKDLVIKLIKMIENNRLDEYLVSDLLKRDERLLEMLISLDSNFKNGVLVLKNNQQQTDGNRIAVSAELPFAFVRLPAYDESY